MEIRIPPCDCVTLSGETWVVNCKCSNRDDTAYSAAWAADANACNDSDALRAALAERDAQLAVAVGVMRDQLAEALPYRQESDLADGICDACETAIAKIATLQARAKALMDVVEAAEIVESDYATGRVPVRMGRLVTALGAYRARLDAKP
jgi:hypothetical protein